MKRLRVINTSGPGGLVNALNLGVQKSDSLLISRLDSDDISTPSRLEEQVQVFKLNTQIGLCGSWAKTFGSARKNLKYPLSSDAIKARMLFSNPFAHSSVTFRRISLPDQNNPYNPSFEVAEDYKLWSEIALNWEVQNLPRYLLNYRVHASQVSVEKSATRIDSVSRIHEHLLQSIGVKFSAEELKLHTTFFTDSFSLGKDPRQLKAIIEWLNKLRSAAVYSGYVDRRHISREIRNQLRSLSGYGAAYPIKKIVDTQRMRVEK